MSRLWGPLSTTTTDLPFKISDQTIVILKAVPVAQCDGCAEYLIADPVFAKVEALLAGVSTSVEVEIICVRCVIRAGKHGDGADGGHPHRLPVSIQPPRLISDGWNVGHPGQSGVRPGGDAPGLRREDRRQLYCEPAEPRRRPGGTTAGHAGMVGDAGAVFDVVVSQVVLDEVGAGDPEAAQRRLALIAGFPLLDITSTVETLAATLIKELPLPPQASAYGVHIAVSACHGVEFRSTWNVAHIANAALRRRVEAVCRRHGYAAPIVCTPDELMEYPDG